MPTAAQCIADMKGNDIVLNGGTSGASWNRGGVVVMGADWRGQATPSWWNSSNKFFGYWNATMPWFVLFDGQGHQNGLNTRVWIKRFVYCIKKPDGTWATIQNTTGIGGEGFARNIIDSTGAGGVSSRNEAGGGISIKLTTTGNIFHGWTGFINQSGADVRGVQIRVTMQLIKDDPNGVDDRHLAVYGVHVGADAYVYSGQRVSDFSPAGYNPGMGCSKFKRVTSTEVEVCYTSLNSALSVDYSSNGGKQSYFAMSEAEFLSNLPPGVTLADTPAPPPIPVSTSRILCLGDELTKGQEAVTNGARSYRGRLYNQLVGEARSVDFIGPVSDTPAVGGDPHHAGYTGAYLGTGGNGSNNLYDLRSAYMASTYQPDLIVLWAGWPSVVNETNPQDKLQALVTQLKVDRPSAKFVLGTLPPLQGSTQAQTNSSTPKYEQLNTRIKQLVAGDPTRIYLADTAAVTLLSADYATTTTLLQSGIDKIASRFVEATNAALYGGTTPGIPAHVGRKEIWISGNATGSAQDGTRLNPINSLSTLRSAIQTYGPTGIDVRFHENGVWSGIFPDELFHYNNSTLKGNDWISDLGYFEGGVRKTDWVTATGAPGGKQLWKCTSMSYQSPSVSMLQPGAVSIDDGIIAHREFTTLEATITAMDDFDEAFSYDPTSNTVYLLLPTGDNPNSLVTMVAQTSECLRNYSFASVGNSRSGIILQHLRLKRYSGFPVNLANLPGIQIKNVYGKHIGSRWRTGAGYEGKFIELYGGCGNFVIEDIRGDGVEQSVVSSQVRSGFATQSSGVVRRVRGSHVGRSIVDYDLQVANSGVMDNHQLEDISGLAIGGFIAAGLRPDGDGIAVVNVAASQGAGTSSINNLVIRRAVAVDAPVAKVTLAYATAGRTIFYEGCQGIATPANEIPYAFAFSHPATGTGSDVHAFRACAVEGYEAGVVNQGGQHAFAVEVTNCGFDDLDVAAIDMNGVPNTALTIQNNAAHNSVLLVKGINGAGSTVDNEGGNYVSSGTTLGVSAVGTDDTAAANPGYVGDSAAKPPSGSALYTGGTALNITLKDRLGQTFQNPWAQGAYAQYSASDGGVGTSPPPVGGSEGISIWESKYVADPADALAWFAENQPGDSTVSSITGIPDTLSLIIGESRQLAPSVNGSGEYDSSVTYSVFSGDAVTVTSAGLIRAIAAGTASVRVTSNQVASIYVSIAVTVSNFSEATIEATPSTLALTLVGGAQSVVVTSANGQAQAGLSALSNNSAVAVCALKTEFDGSLPVTPVGVGTCSILITKTSRAGGVRTIEVPVSVTAGTLEGDVTTIATDGDGIDEDGNHFIEIDDSPYFIALNDQNGDPITGFDHVVEVKLSRPSYIRAPHTVIDGTLPVYPTGVGITTVSLELEDATAGVVQTSFTVEVGPVGGTATPAPTPPPGTSPTDPDPVTTDGDFVFIVEAEE